MFRVVLLALVFDNLGIIEENEEKVFGCNFRRCQLGKLFTHGASGRRLSSRRVNCFLITQPCCEEADREESLPVLSRVLNMLQHPKRTVEFDALLDG